MTKMSRAKAVARIFGNETLAIAVLDGPVLRNMKNTDANIMIQAAGNGVKSMAMSNGTATSIPYPENKKDDPGYLTLSRSPAQPPSSVETNPATTMIAPKTAVDEGGCPRNLR